MRSEEKLLTMVDYSCGFTDSGQNARHSIALMPEIVYDEVTTVYIFSFGNHVSSWQLFGMMAV